MANTKSILFVGGSGFIGSHLAQNFRDEYKVFLSYHQKHFRIPGVTSIRLDVTDKERTKRNVGVINPDILIYLAGSNHVDHAESNQGEAERLHASGAMACLEGTQIQSTRAIYLSSGFVFDGQRGNYHEEDLALPSLALGKSQLGGEAAFRGKSKNWLILRSAPLIGRGNGRHISMLDYFRVMLDRKKHVEASTIDQHNYATVEQLSSVIQSLLKTDIINKIFHFGGKTKMSEFDLARLFAKRFGYDPKLVIPKAKKEKIEDPNKKAIRTTVIGTDFSVNSSLLAKTMDFKPLLIEESFDLIQKSLIS